MIFLPGIATGRRRSGAAPVARGHEPAAAERHPRRVSDLRQEIRQRQDTTAHGGARVFNLAIRACACRNYDHALDCCEESSSNLKQDINLSKFFQVCKAAQDKKPRDVFDVQGQRLQGTEAEGNLNSLRRENSSDLGMTMTNWKSQHDQVSDQRCLGSGWISKNFQIFL